MSKKISTYQTYMPLGFNLLYRFLNHKSLYIYSEKDSLKAIKKKLSTLSALNSLYSFYIPTFLKTKFSTLLDKHCKMF